MKQRVDRIIDDYIGGAGEITGKIIGWSKSKIWFILCATGAILVIGAFAFFSKLADGYKKHGMR